MATRTPGQRSTRSITSRSSISALEPFTVAHLEVYASVCVLDNGRPFILEDFQSEIAADIFAGYQETWLVLPEGSGKTTFLGLLALYFGDYTPSAMIPIAASSREQAEIMYRQAEGLVSRSPELKARFRAYAGYRRIKCHRTDGRIQVYAADDRTGDGIIPGGLALVDELHRHRDLKLYRTWKGKLDKRGAQLVTISTAGEPGGDFEDTRAHIRKSAGSVRTSRSGCHVRAAGRDIVLHDFAVPSMAQADDMDIVALANPRKDVTAERLRGKRDSPTMTREHWLRFVCNIATLSGGSGISPEEWDALYEANLIADRSATTFGWLDLGWKIDCTALGALVWESPERRVVSDVLILPPPVQEWSIVAGILTTQERYTDFRGWVYDPNAGGQQMAQLLENGQHPLQTDDDARELAGLPRLDGRTAPQVTFIEHSQDNAPMADAAAKFDEAVRNKWLVHDGHRGMRSHVLNAIARSLGGEKWKFDRPNDAKGEKRGRYPIDALTGLLMGHRVVVAEAESAQEFVFEVLG
jgi:phage terminase large subunit-like protein